jgi:hypothetical protein
VPLASWLGWPLGVIMVAVGLYHALRLAPVGLCHGARRSPVELCHGARRSPVGWWRWPNREPDVDLTHVVMAAAMAAMLLGRLGPTESVRCAVVFAIPSLWFAVRAVNAHLRDRPAAIGPNGRQSVSCLAMAYMLLVPVALAPGSSSGGLSGQMAGMTAAGRTGHIVTLSWIADATLVLAMVAVAAHSTAAVFSRRSSAATGRTSVLPASCQLAMNVTTVIMLAASL